MDPPRIAMMEEVWPLLDNMTCQQVCTNRKADTHVHIVMTTSTHLSPRTLIHTMGARPY